MSRSLRPLVFDLDGTLIDSRRDIAAACNHVLRSLGEPVRSVEVISAHVGSGARALLRGVLEREVLEEEMDELLARFQEYYLLHPVDENRFLPGALEALALRKSRPIALCTNKPWRLTSAVIQALSWTDLFDVVVAPESLDRLKPDPQLLLRVASRLHVDPATLIMIGDGPQDVGAGRAVGAHTIGVCGGFVSRERLAESNPHVLLTDLQQLGDYLLGIDD